MMLLGRFLDSIVLWLKRRLHNIVITSQANLASFTHPFVNWKYFFYLMTLLLANELFKNFWACAVVFSSLSYTFFKACQHFKTTINWQQNALVWHLWWNFILISVQDKIRIIFQIKQNLFTILDGWNFLFNFSPLRNRAKMLSNCNFSSWIIPDFQN